MTFAAMAQLVEHILGKDEVPGPNPGSSSRQPRGKHLGALVFYRNFSNTCRNSFVGVVRGCYSRFALGFSSIARKPVRIATEAASSSLVRRKVGNLRIANIRENKKERTFVIMIVLSFCFIITSLFSH